jgi:hypothetical protein
MRSFQTIHFFVAVGLAAGLLSAAPSYAKNLNLQNQNHVGHCDVAGNCRPGHTGTSQPVAQGGVRAHATGALGHVSGGARGARK